MQGVLAALGVQKFDMVAHDIGDMVGFPLATQLRPPSAADARHKLTLRLRREADTATAIGKR